MFKFVLNVVNKKRVPVKAFFKTLCMLGNFTFFVSYFSTLHVLFFKLSSECQTAWIQIRPHSVRPDLGPNCLQRSSADDKLPPLAGKELRLFRDHIFTILDATNSTLNFDTLNFIYNAV